MRKKVFGILLCAVLLALSIPAEAQRAGKVYRIGFLRTGSGSPITSPVAIAFRQRLRELGYVEGQNYVIEYRSTEGKRERRPEIAAELVRLKVDVIVTQGGSPRLIRAAQGATRTIPIVMTGVHVDPIAAGLVVSLARPGGTITGLTNLAAKLHTKQLELLKEAFPQNFPCGYPLASATPAPRDERSRGRGTGFGYPNPIPGYNRTTFNQSRERFLCNQPGAP